MTQALTPPEREWFLQMLVRGWTMDWIRRAFVDGGRAGAAEQARTLLWSRGGCGPASRGMPRYQYEQESGGMLCSVGGEWSNPDRQCLLRWREIADWVADMDPATVPHHASVRNHPEQPAFPRSDREAHFAGPWWRAACTTCDWVGEWTGYDPAMTAALKHQHTVVGIAAPATQKQLDLFSDAA